tara:strand:- start:230 stop:382 length:153 start_codon:yes stop_codon:yes gene_type:complete
VVTLKAAMRVKTARQGGGTLVITADDPPVNALHPDVAAVNGVALGAVVSS